MRERLVISVPAGEFHDVLGIDRQQMLCADAGIVSEWFAPGVSLIRRVGESIAGPVASELVKAELGSRRRPRSTYQTCLLPDVPIPIEVVSGY